MEHLLRWVKKAKQRFGNSSDQVYLVRQMSFATSKQTLTEDSYGSISVLNSLRISQCNGFSSRLRGSHLMKEM